MRKNENKYSEKKVKDEGMFSSFEERNDFIQKEVEFFGMPRDFRLVNFEKFVAPKELRWNYENGKLTLLKTTIELEKKFYFAHKGKNMFFSSDKDEFKFACPEYEVEELTNFKVGDSFPCFLPIKAGKLCFFTSPNEKFYKLEKWSKIGIYVLRDGIVGIQLYNLDDIETISFKESDRYEHTLDILTDQKTGKNISMDGTYKVICSPILATALKTMSLLSPYDMIDGSIYYHSEYIYDPFDENVDLFLNVDRYLDLDITARNQNFFKNEDDDDFEYNEDDFEK